MSTDSISVFVRVRPDARNEERCCTVYNDSRSIDLCKQPQNPTITTTVTGHMDGVFDGNACQQDVFDRVSSSVDAVLQGYNATVFCYGQTGTGKTYTMTGTLESTVQPGDQTARAGPDDDYVLPADAGIVQRAAAMIFAEADRRGDHTVKVHCSYLEIYSEKVHDLLQMTSWSQGSTLSSTGKKDDCLAVVADKNGTPYVKNLTETPVRSTFPSAWSPARRCICAALRCAHLSSTF